MDAFEKELSDAFAEMILAGGATNRGIPREGPSAEPPPLVVVQE